MPGLTPTRFYPGVNNLRANNIFNGLRVPDPTTYHHFLDDFDRYVAADYTVTETQAGATQALTAGDGGLILLTNTAANNDVNQIQKTTEGFLMESGKQFFLRVRGKVSDATNAAFYAGLQVTNADGSSSSAVDGIYFLKPAASTSVSAYCRKNATTGSTSGVVATMASDTFITLEAFFDGVSRLVYGYNGTIVGVLDASSTYLPDTTLTPILGVKNGTAAAYTATFDYIYAAKER